MPRSQTAQEEKRAYGRPVAFVECARCAAIFAQPRVSLPASVVHTNANGSRRSGREQAREALRRQEGQGRLQRLERLSRPIPESILTLLPTLPPDECAAILRAYSGITPLLDGSHKSAAP